MQEHEPAPLRSLQMAFAPQGEGLHGFEGCSVGWTEEFKVLLVQIPFNP